MDDGFLVCKEVWCSFGVLILVYSTNAHHNGETLYPQENISYWATLWDPAGLVAAFGIFILRWLPSIRHEFRHVYEF